MYQTGRHFYYFAFNSFALVYPIGTTAINWQLIIMSLRHVMMRQKNETLLSMVKLYDKYSSFIKDQSSVESPILISIE